jgi:hypothetical protein
MPVTLRKQRDQEIVEGRKPVINWADDDYAVADGEIRIGRIYRARLPAGETWLWFLHLPGASPNGGTGDTLDEAKTALTEVYERFRDRQK